MSSGSLRHPGSSECFLWMRMMKKPCSLVTQKKSHRCGQSVALPLPHQRTPTPISPLLSLLVLLCHLVDKARAEHLTAAERPVPYFLYMKSGNTIVSQHFLQKFFRYYTKFLICQFLVKIFFFSKYFNKSVYKLTVIWSCVDFVNNLVCHSFSDLFCLFLNYLCIHSVVLLSVFESYSNGYICRWINNCVICFFSRFPHVWDHEEKICPGNFNVWILFTFPRLQWFDVILLSNLEAKVFI